VLVWLGYINVVLAIFNMAPGYPLDGGRVLRAAAWAMTRDRNRATRIAARAGQVVALLLIGYGLFGLLAGAGFAGLWPAFVGWFLLAAAQHAYAESEMETQLRDVRVGDVMSSDCGIVDERTTVREFVEEYCSEPAAAASSSSTTAMSRGSLLQPMSEVSHPSVGRRCFCARSCGLFAPCERSVPMRP
jgi:hypothetical protein